jgi:hypothetical protein
MYYLLGLLVAIAVAVVIYMRRGIGNMPETDIEKEQEISPIISDCCGAHEICEFNASQFSGQTIIYFDDEELDELRNVRETDLSDKNIDDLREVLYTLQANEIKPWLNSLQQRHIHLPPILQQEARQLMADK